MQDLDTLMSSYSPLNLQDILSAGVGVGTGGGGNNNFNSPDGRSGEFTDLLSDFTLTTGNVLSPDTLGKSPEVSSGGSGSGSGGIDPEEYTSGGSVGERVINQSHHSNSKSPEERLDSTSLGVSPMDSSSEGYEFIRSTPQQQDQQDTLDRIRRAKQLADAISNMDSTTQAQLLKALLPGGNSSNDSRTSPMDQSPAPHSHSQIPNSYAHRSQSDSSRLASPAASRSFSNNSIPPLQQQQQLPVSQEYFDAITSAHHIALNTSLPPSIVPSPHASPFMHPTYYPHPPSHLQLQQQQQLQPRSPQSYLPQPQQQQQQFSQQHQTQLPSPQSFNNLIPNSYQNAFSPQNFTRTTSGDLQAQLALEALNLGFSPSNAQIQNGISQTQSQGGGESVATSNAGHTGGSYATTATTDDWGENDFMFSPLMSPALTAHSVFSAASSLPPSASCLPPPHLLQGVNPTDFFSPLGSPAILPQNFQLATTLPGSTNLYQQTGYSSPASLPQSQTQSQSRPISQPHSRSHSIPLTQLPPQTMSPQLMATTTIGEADSSDAGMSTAAGSGRRGAGSGVNKKSRPSPLLKPTPDVNLRRKKLPAVGGNSNERRSSSSTGMRSVTTSPFLGPAAFSMTSSNNNSVNGHNSSSSGPNSSKTSPQELLGGGTGTGTGGESDNTPSPVDLTVSEITNGIVLQHSTPSHLQHQHQHLQQQQGLSTYDLASTSYLPEFMGPPPPPSNPPSRRPSLNTSTLPIPLSAMETGGGGGAWNPVTPATLMNFASDLAGAGLSNLSYPHHLLPHHLQQQQQQQQQQQEEEEQVNQDFNIDYNYNSTTSSTMMDHQSQEQQIQSDSIAVDDSDNIQVVDPIISKAKAKKLAATVAANNANTNSNAAGGVKGKGKAVTAKAAKAANAAKNKATGAEARKLSIGSASQDGPPIHPTTNSGASGADNRRTTHKAAEQKRRDSLKQCFEELRKILPPMTNFIDPEDRRPGEGNVGGQRSGSVDPENPNRGVSKVALLRRSNDYITTLGERIERRDLAVNSLRDMISELRNRLGEDEGDSMDLYDDLDRDELAPKTMAFYENLDSDDEELEYKPRPKKGTITAAARRKSDAAEARAKAFIANGNGAGSRRSSRITSNGDDDIFMDVERD